MFIICSVEVIFPYASILPGVINADADTCPLALILFEDVIFFISALAPINSLLLEIFPLAVI